MYNLLNVFGGNRGKRIQSKRQSLAKTIRFESLESRAMMAIISSYNATTHLLTVTGDTANNAITLGQSAGVATVNGVPVSGATASAITAITVSGGDGVDTIDLTAVLTTDFTALSTGAITINGDAGNDTISGTSYGDIINGGSGDDILYGLQGADRLTGASGDDTLYGGTGNDTFIFTGTAGIQDDDTLYETSGTDTLDFTGLSQAITVDISNGAKQDVYAVNQFTITNASVAENVTGTQYNDTITGNSSANVIQGAQGNDTLVGGAGDDTFKYTGTASALGADSISDSSGVDVLDFTGLDSAVTVDLSTASQQNIVGSSFKLSGLTLIQNVIGTAFSDTITGNSTANTLNGGAGNDTYKFVGGASQADDTITDSSGIDTIDFRGMTVGVDINIATATQQNVVSSSFRLTGASVLENIFGSDYGDVINGNSAANRIFCGDGDDQLAAAGGNDFIAGEEGDDYLAGDGGGDIYYFDPGVGLLGTDDIVELTINGGTDFLDFSHFSSAITINTDIVYPTTQTVVAGVLSLNLISNLDESVEGVVGGSGNDTISGGSSSNFFYGGGGNDTIDGGYGGDFLFGEDGDDTLIGGLGIHNDVLRGENGNDSLYGGLGDDSLYGGDGDDFLTDYRSSISTTEGGNDYFDGGLGEDSLYSYSGNDHVEGGGDDDDVHGGTGDDTYYFKTYYGDVDLGLDTIDEAAGSGNDVLDFSHLQVNTYSSPSLSFTLAQPIGQTTTAFVLSIELTNPLTIETVIAPTASLVQVTGGTVVASGGNYSINVSTNGSTSTQVNFYAVTKSDGHTVTNLIATDNNGADGWNFYTSDTALNFADPDLTFFFTVNGSTAAAESVYFLPYRLTAY